MDRALGPCLLLLQSA